MSVETLSLSDSAWTYLGQPPLSVQQTSIDHALIDYAIPAEGAVVGDTDAYPGAASADGISLRPGVITQCAPVAADDARGVFARALRGSAQVRVLGRG